MNASDNIPEYRDPDQQEVTVTLTKYQARLVLSALNRRFVEFEQEGLDELKADVQKAYKSVDLQVYGVRLGREGVQEAGR